MAALVNATVPPMSNCGTCGTALDPTRALYDETGMLSCDRCLELAKVREHHVKSNTNARAVAYANVALGVGSFLFTPLSFFTFGVLAWVVGNIRVSEARGERLPDAGSRLFAAAIGAILGATSLVVVFLR
jgi:hypothetical protein